MRGGTLRKLIEALGVTRFQPTLPVRGWTLRYTAKGNAGSISIHPPRAGRDHLRHDRNHHHQDFNPPSPCREGPKQRFYMIQEYRFQPTLPVREGTLRLRRVWRPQLISTHPPVRGGTQDNHKSQYRITISTHPPRAGRDPGGRRGHPPVGAISTHPPVRGGTKNIASTMAPEIFQLTLPVRGRTICRPPHLQQQDISTHSPRAGRDCPSRSPGFRRPHFNPPSPCGEGPMEQAQRLYGAVFQPTLPVRGGTHAVIVALGGHQISTHPPRAGRDQQEDDPGPVAAEISTHPPRAGRDHGLKPYFRPR